MIGNPVLITISVNRIQQHKKVRNTADYLDSIRIETGERVVNLCASLNLLSFDLPFFWGGGLSVYTVDFYTNFKSAMLSITNRI